MTHTTMVPSRVSHAFLNNFATVSHNLSTNMLWLTVGPRGYPEVNYLMKIFQTENVSDAELENWLLAFSF